MKIAIMGAGNVGKALGSGWGRAGHEISFGVPDPFDPRHEKAAEMAGNAIVASVADAANSADLLAFAVPWDAVPEVIGRCGPLAGKIIIDATNPLSFGEHGLALALGFATSGGEEIARLAPEASVFKTLNQVGFAVIADATGYSTRPAMFVAGDDDTRKPLVSDLVEDLGFEAIDAGPLCTARLLEPYAMLWIDQAVNRGAPTNNAFAFMRRGERS